MHLYKSLLQYYKLKNGLFDRRKSQSRDLSNFCRIASKVILNDSSFKHVSVRPLLLGIR